MLDQAAKDSNKAQRELVDKAHKIGDHGAIGLLTQQGLICGECHKVIKKPTKLLYGVSRRVRHR